MTERLTLPDDFLKTIQNNLINIRVEFDGINAQANLDILKNGSTLRNFYEHILESSAKGVQEVSRIIKLIESHLGRALDPDNNEFGLIFGEDQLLSPIYKAKKFFSKLISICVNSVHTAIKKVVEEVKNFIDKEFVNVKSEIDKLLNLIA